MKKKINYYQNKQTPINQKLKKSSERNKVRVPVHVLSLGGGDCSSPVNTSV